MDRADLAVEQWARERPDLRTLPMALFGRLNEAAERVMREHMNPLFAKAGLQAGEFDVLATLRRAGPPYTLSPTQLYEAMMISSGGMTDRLDRLESIWCGDPPGDRANALTSDSDLWSARCGRRPAWPRSYDQLASPFSTSLVQRHQCRWLALGCVDEGR